MMTYDQRIAATEEWMADPASLFRRRTPPNRLKADSADETEARQTGELRIIAEAIVRAAPVVGLTDFRQLLEDAGRRFELEATTASWPLPKEMPDAIRAVVPAPQSNRADPNGSVQLTDRERAQVAAIQARRWGDVSGFYITGVGARRLLEHGLISADDVRAFEDHRRAQEMPKVAGGAV